MNEYCQDTHSDGETSIPKNRAISKGRADPRILIPTLLLLIAVFYVYVASAVPASTYVSPTLPDNSTTNYSWVFVNVTSSEPLAVAYLEWGNSSGFTNVSMLNNTALTWYKNMTDLDDGAYNYTVYAQNTTGSWNQSARRFVTVDAVSPYGISSCQNLSVPGGYYALTQNVSSAGTCFTIGADNVTLDGQGYTINYSRSQTGYAINNSLGYDNVTIKNTLITNMNPNATGANITIPYAVYGYGMSNSTIDNNTITAGVGAIGMYLVSASDSNTISNNNITTSGDSGHGIYLTSSRSNTLSNNTITSSGTASHGVYLSSSNSTTLSNNTIRAFGGYSYGIYLNSSTSNVISNNNVTNDATVFGYSTGIYLLSSASNTLSDNVIATLVRYSYGIHLNSSVSNTISNNNITTSDDTVYGIYFQLNSTSNTISNNNITTSGQYGVAIYFVSSGSNIVSNNNITTLGLSGDGIIFSSAVSNSILNNVLTTSGTAAYGMFISASSNSSTMSNNTVTTSGSQAYGVYITSSGSNNFTGGSIISRASYDYYLQDAGTSNNFTATNFTSSRTVYFSDSDSWFNYNNQTAGNIWLKTSSAWGSMALTRTLASWSSAMLKWNDTSSPPAKLVGYNITRLSANAQYSVYNASNVTQTLAYNLTTDSNGNLPNFTIILYGNMEITVQQSPVSITVNSPSNTTYPLKWVWANMTFSESAAWCGVSLNGTENRTLSNTSALAWWLNLSVPSDGLNNVTFYCNDTIGNMTQSATRSFTIDTVHPLIMIQSPLNTTYPQNWTWANLTLNEPGNWCGASLNSGTNQTLTNSTGRWWMNFTVLTEGQNNVTFYCNDTAGNMNSSSVVFTIDTVPSITVLSPAVNATYAQKWVWANVSLSEPGSWCGVSLNGTTNQTLANSTGNWWMNLSVPAEGLNNVTFYCNDTTGNLGFTATRNFTIDTIHPLITIQSPLNTTYPQKWVWANLTLNEPGNRCGVSLNEGTNQTLTNSTGKWWLNLSVPAEGLNNVTFYCNDTAGNMNSSSVVFTIDTVPSITVFSPDVNATYAQKWVWANVSLSEPGSWCGVSLNGTTNQTLTNSTGKWWLNLSVPVEGLNNVTFYCNDTIGNMVQSATRNFTIDTAAPLITIQSPSNITYSQAWVWANVSLNKAGSCDVSLNGTANQTMSNFSATVWYLYLSVPVEGLNNVTFYCNDTAGNTNSSSVVFTVSVIPEITILSPSANANYTQNLIWANVSLNESGSWCGVSLNGTINQTLANSTGKWWLNLSVPAEGLNNVTFYCNDTIGNMVQSATRNLTIDTIVPSITFSGQTPNNNEVVNRSYAFINVTASENLSVALLEWNLTANQTMQGVGTGWYINKTDLANGNYTFRVYVNDTLGNRNSTEQRWVYINFTNTTTYAYNFTLGNSTGGVISNASLQIYTDTTDVLSDFRFNSSTTSAGVNLSMGVKYHVKYSLPAGVVLDIKNITINATTTISPQFVDSYAGSLPSSTSAKSYAIALNDSTLSYGYAELTLPITGTANRVLHCLSWNFTPMTCSSWESNALSSYSYRLNSTHLVFNVTSFDAYMAGYYEAAATPTPTPSASTSGGSGSGGGSSEEGATTVAPTANKTVHAKVLGPFAAFEAIISESATQSPEIKATELPALPFGVIQPAGVPYLYAEITSNFNTSAYLKEARIDFKVNKSWYSSNSVSPASTKLLRYTGKYWQSLPTVMNGDDEIAYSFSANTTAFSTFAIVGIKKPGPVRVATVTATPTRASTSVVAPSPTPTATPSVGLTKIQSLLLLILLLLFVIIVVHMFLEKGKPPAQPTLEECLDEVKEEIHPPSENEDRPREPEPDDNVEKG